MSKIKFTVLVNEVFNEFDCKLLGMKYDNKIEEYQNELSKIYKRIQELKEEEE